MTTKSPPDPHVHPAELSSGALYVHGHDVHGRSVLTMRNGRHLTSTTWYDKPRLYATCVWLVEQAALVVLLVVVGAHNA